MLDAIMWSAATDPRSGVLYLIAATAVRAAALRVPALRALHHLGAAASRGAPLGLNPMPPTTGILICRRSCSPPKT
jgi:hypothetical protein